MPIASRMEEGKARRCACKLWRARTCWQSRANFADLPAVNRKQLYQGYYRREMSHDPTTHIITYYRSTVWGFIDHIYLAPGRETQAQRVYVKMRHFMMGLKDLGPVFAMDKAAELMGTRPVWS